MIIKTLAAWRTTRNLTCVALGRKCDVGARTIRNIEKEGYVPSQRIALAIAAALNVEVGQIEELASLAGEAAPVAPIEHVLDSDPFWKTLTVEELAEIKREVSTKRRRDALWGKRFPSRGTEVQTETRNEREVKRVYLPEVTPRIYSNEERPDYEGISIYESLLSVTKHGTFNPFDSSDPNVKSARDRLTPEQWNEIVAAYRERVATE